MRTRNFNKKGQKPSSVISIEELKKEDTPDNIPSFFNCFPCFMNLNDKNVSETAKDQNLTYDERINNVFTKLHTIDEFNLLANQYKSIFIEDMRKLMHEMAKKINEYEKRGEILSNPTDTILEKVKPMIPVEGLKYIVGQKIGYFFFNEHNESGLHLPKIYIDQIAEIIVENFTDPEGKLLSIRTFVDNITRGANMKKGEKYSA